MELADVVISGKIPPLRPMPLHSLDWKLELSDRDGAVHCQLLQGRATDDGSAAWAAHTSLQLLADAAAITELLVASRAVGTTHDAWLEAVRCGGDGVAAWNQHLDARRTVAALLRTRLPDPVRAQLDAWMPKKGAAVDLDHAPSLLFAVAAGDHPQSQALFGGCRFECFELFAEGYVGLRRLQVPQRTPPREPAEAPQHKPLRLLVLVGDLRDPTGWDRHALAAIRTLRAIEEQFLKQQLGRALEVVVAAGCGCAHQLGVDDVVSLATPTELENLLRSGMARPVGARKPFDGLVTLGHSDGATTRDASGLRVDFGAAAPTFSPGTLVDWFGADLQFVLLLNCKSSDFAAHFLPHVDHVLAAAPMLQVTHAELLVKELFAEQLIRDVGLNEAARRARAQLEHAHRGAGWSLVHLSRTEHDCVFVSRERWLLTKFYRDTYEHEATMRVAYGGKHEFELTRIHVALEVRQAQDRKAQLLWQAVRGIADVHGNRVAHADIRPDNVMISPGSVEPIRLVDFGFSHREPTLRDLLDSGITRWLLRGEPGGGKTTTLRFCALEWPTNKLVLYIPLSRWADVPGLPETGESLLYAADASIRPDLVEVVNLRAAAGRLIVLLDAYDEVPEAQRQHVDGLLRWFKKSWPKAIVVVTARPSTVVESIDPKPEEHPAVTAEGWHRAEVRPMGEREQSKLLGNWFRCVGFDQEEDLASRALAAMAQAGQRLQDMARNPLMLTMLATVLIEELNRGKSHDFTWLPQLKRYELLEQAVSTWMDGIYTNIVRRVGFTGRTRDVVRCLLRRIAWKMTENGTTVVDGRALLQWVLAKDADAIDIPSLLDKRDWTDKQFLAQLRDHAGVLRPDDALADAKWRFLHRHILEALAAEYWWHVELVKVPEAQRAEAVMAKVPIAVTDKKAATKLEFWVEPLVLVAERMGQADALLVPLLKRKATRPAGIRVLMALDVVAPATVRDVLGSRCLPSWSEREELPPFGSWSARALVLEVLCERLPRGIANASAAVQPLLDRTKAVGVELAEVGAIVWCLERNGQWWHDREAVGRLAPAAKVRSVPTLVWLAIEEVLQQPRFGQLSFDDIDGAGIESDGSPRARHFTAVQVPEAGRREANESHSLWCEIPATTSFRIGSDRGGNEAPPPQEVSLPSFRMQATAVTEAQWSRFDLHVKRTESQLPKVNVTWYEARLFARWLTLQLRRLPEAGWGVPRGFEFDLPTEAEREWAARGGTRTAYWSGDTEADLARVGWYAENSGYRLQNVGQRPANAFGLRDVHGNSLDWTLDAYQERLSGGEQPLVIRSGAPRVVRGGSCRGDAGVCRAASRGSSDPCGRYGDNLGLRLVCVGVSPQLDS